MLGISLRSRKMLRRVANRYHHILGLFYWGDRILTCLWLVVWLGRVGGRIRYRGVSRHLCVVFLNVGNRCEGCATRGHVRQKTGANINAIQESGVDTCSKKLFERKNKVVENISPRVQVWGTYPEAQWQGKLVLWNSLCQQTLSLLYPANTGF